MNSLTRLRQQNRILYDCDKSSLLQYISKNPAYISDATYAKIKEQLDDSAPLIDGSWCCEGLVWKIITQSIKAKWFREMELQCTYQFSFACVTTKIIDKRERKVWNEQFPPFPSHHTYVPVNNRWMKRTLCWERKSVWRLIREGNWDRCHACAMD